MTDSPDERYALQGALSQIDCGGGGDTMLQPNDTRNQLDYDNKMTDEACIGAG
jgi:hypothetical protein